MSKLALFRRFESELSSIPWCDLGDWPTRVDLLEAMTTRLACGPLHAKREDLSAEAYGGNKVRTLESLFGAARAEGVDRIWTTGAYGSNHALAMAFHAPKAGLRSGAILFPQPKTKTAAANLEALLTTDTKIVRLFNVVALPFAMQVVSRSRSEKNEVMVPGGATPLGALGHVSAAIELAEQIEQGLCPVPKEIVLAVGSTCTSAGIVVGLLLARRLGIAFGPDNIPHVVAVRVTPWPVTSPVRIARLAHATSKLLERRVGDIARFSYSEIRRHISVDARFFGGGYGKPIRAGPDAKALFEASNGPQLDEVYAEKSGAAFLARARAKGGPMLYWATRSSQPLPQLSESQLASAPSALRRWLGKSNRSPR